MATRNSDGTFTMTVNEIRDLMKAAVPEAEASVTEPEDDTCDTNDTTIFDRMYLRTQGRVAQAALTLHGHPFEGGKMYNNSYKVSKIAGYKSSRRPIASAMCESLFDGDADKMYRTFHPFRTLFNDLF